MREGVIGPESHQFAEDVRGLRGLAADKKSLPEAAQGDSALGPDARGDGEEPDCLVGTAAGHQFPSEIGIDPEIVAMRRLGTPEERDRRFSPAEERQGGGQTGDACDRQVFDVRGCGEPFEVLEPTRGAAPHLAQRVSQPIPPRIGVGSLRRRD